MCVQYVFLHSPDTSLVEIPLNLEQWAILWIWKRHSKYETEPVWCPQTPGNLGAAHLATYLEVSGHWVCLVWWRTCFSAPDVLCCVGSRQSGHGRLWPMQWLPWLGPAPGNRAHPPFRAALSHPLCHLSMCDKATCTLHPWIVHTLVPRSAGGLSGVINPDVALESKCLIVAVHYKVILLLFVKREDTVCLRSMSRTMVRILPLLQVRQEPREAVSAGWNARFCESVVCVRMVTTCAWLINSLALAGYHSQRSVTESCVF